MTDDVLPTEDGLYLDSGGYPWQRDQGRWTILRPAGSYAVPMQAPPAFAPFVRLRPERPVPGMLGR